MPEPTYAWHIDWFRHPDRIFGVPVLPASLNLICTAALMVVTDRWYLVIIGIIVHLALDLRTVKVRALYGVRGPMTDDLQQWIDDARKEIDRE